MTLSQIMANLEITRPVALRRLNALNRRDLVVLEARYQQAPRHRRATLYSAAEGAAEGLAALARRAPRQAELLKGLLAAAGPITAAELPGKRESVRRALAALVERRLAVAVGTQEPKVGPVGPASLAGRGGDVTLTGPQEEAVAAITAAIGAGQPGVFLLHGVTGSGKTEVYMRAIQAARDRGQQALVLVPEISLTPQAAARYEERFPGEVALLHSRLAGAERTGAWRRLKEGRARIAIGPRSAVFSPLDEVGLIVIDEEHEPSYKQEEIPRYDARAVARFRALRSGAALVAGSATPSLELYAEATGLVPPAGEGATGGGACARLLRLPERVDGLRLPAVELVDMRAELAEGNRLMFSRRLQAAMAGALAEGQQTILFMNRRGLATFILCRECGLVVRCPACDVALVYHHQEKALRCHYCGHAAPPPTVCPGCKGKRIRYFGAGTERVEAQVRELLPAARVARLDSDVANRRGRVAAILDAFAKREVDILVGTQMIGKGLDLPDVTVVGVIAADASLAFPDFRAAERTFNLVTQVAGRAGRGLAGGTVVVQSYNPDHYSLEFAVRHDYEGFAQQELDYRRQLDYPPFSHLALIRVASGKEGAAVAAANDALDLIRARLGGDGEELAPGRILGPAPAPLYRLQGRYRWNIILRDADPTVLAGHCSFLLDELQGRLDHEVRIGVDVDPQSLM